MTNEELMQRISEGDESTLETLCVQNTGLVRGRALNIAQAYYCVQRQEQGQYTPYTKETLSDLESVGILAFLECVRSGNYDSAQGALSTYVVPFLDAAMRRYLESSLGSLSLDRNSMALVRRAQGFHRREGTTAEEVAAELGISPEAAARHIAYPTHFFSVYDLADPEANGDVFDYIAADSSCPNPADVVYHRIRMEYLRELFDTLSKKDRDILGKCFGVFGYPKLPLRDIAMYHMMKEDAVEKNKERILKELRNRYPNSKLWWWNQIHRMLNHQQ